MIRIHIVGSPRSGTTLMHQLVVNCFDVDGYAPEEMPIYYEPAQRFERFCSKWPFDVLHVRPYLAFMPDLWVIVMLRDPRDVVTSIHGKAKDMYFNNLREWRQCADAARRLRPHPRVVTLKYEELVRDPEAIEAELRQRLPFLRQVRPFAEYHVSARPSKESLGAMHGVRPINQTSIGAWRSHKPRLAAQIRIHGPITRELVELGYEPDDGWTEELRGVTPKNGTSRFNDWEALTRKNVVARSKRVAAVGAAFLQHRLLRPALGRPVYLYREVVRAEPKSA